MKKIKKTKFKFKPIPPFKSYEEEANFWDTHSVTDFIDPKTVVVSRKGFSAAIDPKKVKKEASMTIRLQREIQRKLEAIASERGMSVSTLARKFISDGLGANVIS